MKRTLVLAISVLVACAQVFAYDFMVDDLCYNINADGTSVTVKALREGGSPTYPDLSGALEIPPSVSYEGVTYAVTTIGDYAFRGCAGLTSLSIPESVTSIGDYAFSSCRGFTGELIIPNSVTSIGQSAFSDCCGFTSLTIGNSVTSIDNFAFGYCVGFTSIVVDDANTMYDSRGDCNAIIETESNTLIFGCNNTVIPNTVIAIGDGAFEGCDGMVSLTIPDSVTSIGKAAFALCRGLTGELIIPNSVTSIGEFAFWCCEGLTGELIIPNSVASIGRSAFESCSGLSGVIISNSITSIGESTFCACRGIKSVMIPNSVTSIGINAFNGCGELSTITIPNSVVSICAGAFCNCSGLTGELTIPDNVKEIGNCAFDSCSGLTSLTVGESLESIGERAFGGCTGLKSVLWNAVYCFGPYSMYTQASGPFGSLTGITSFIFGNKVERIPENLCRGLSGLASITIPNSVTSIGSYAFCGCSGLTSITIPFSVSSIGSTAFGSCTGLKELVWNAKDCSSTGSITSLGLTSIIIGDEVQTLPRSFARRSKITEIIIPNSVKSIGVAAFEGSTDLTNVTIGSSVTEIGSNAFGRCSGLLLVTNHALTPQTIEAIVFNDVDVSKCKLCVWHEAIDKYKEANVWKDFLIEDLGGVEGVEADTEAKTVEGYYNLQGVRIDNPASGQVSIVRYTDGTAKKIVVR
ncbi:MAG: leucine-rich repeat domain-containing protein [Muribaculaceae bacterium]|nr:leucine-rich repeat domain-containing protein [Muribaculaceae bacterium]